VKTSLSQDDINRAIVSADYYQFPGTTTTVCCLTLKDGFTVIGQSACIDPTAFDAALGRKIANDDAVNKVWQLEGYLLNYKIKRGIVAAEEEAAAEAEMVLAPDAPEIPETSNPEPIPTGEATETPAA
jgi:hypothetical protein